MEVVNFEHPGKGYPYPLLEYSFVAVILISLTAII